MTTRPTGGNPTNDAQMRPFMARSTQMGVRTHQWVVIDLDSRSSVGWNWRDPKPPEPMNTSSKSPVAWTLPADIPPAFALPQEFRQSLPAEVQAWLASVEKRIDGMTFSRIEEEADKLAGEDSPEAGKLFWLGRRLFYTRMQQIVDIMFPGQGVEVGVNLLWPQTWNELPGGAVSNAVCDGENINGCCLSNLKEAGFAVD